MEENDPKDVNKFAEFSIGCLGNFIVLSLILFFIKYLNELNSDLTNYINTIAVVIILSELIVIYKLSKNKKYIAIGMVAFILLPILIFGTCSLIFFH